MICVGKGTVFFFSHESSWLIHSFKIQNLFREAEKKKLPVFFFLKKSSWAIHQFLAGSHFFYTKLGCIFFSAFLCVFSVFFFSHEKFMCHSFIRSQGCFFFRRRKKKQLFHSSNRFFPKVR